jgi:hypothetical protein
MLFNVLQYRHCALDGDTLCLIAHTVHSSALEHGLVRRSVLEAVLCAPEARRRLDRALAAVRRHAT